MDDPQRRLIRALSVMPSMKARIDEVIVAEYTADSLARIDAEVPFGKCVTIFSAQSLVAAGDHLLAWHALVKARRHPLIAHMTLIRSALEGAVRCLWLVDPAVSAAERGRRGALAHLEDLVEKRRFLGGADKTPEASRLARRAVRHERASRRAIAAQGWGDGPRINVGELFDLYGDGSWSWRITSGFAHAREWALSTSARTDTQERLGQETIVHTAVNWALSADLTRHAVIRLDTALTGYASYRGVKRPPSPSV